MPRQKAKPKRHVNSVPPAAQKVVQRAARSVPGAMILREVGNTRTRAAQHPRAKAAATIRRLANTQLQGSVYTVEGRDMTPKEFFDWCSRAPRGRTLITEKLNNQVVDRWYLSVRQTASALEVIATDFDDPEDFMYARVSTTAKAVIRLDDAYPERLVAILLAVEGSGFPYNRSGARVMGVGDIDFARAFFPNARRGT